MTSLAALLAFIAAVWLADRLLRARWQVPPTVPCEVCRQPTRMRVRMWGGRGALRNELRRLASRGRALCPAHAADELAKLRRSP